MCGVKLNLKKYYLRNKLPNESIILMLSTAKIITMIIVKSITIFYDFSTMKAFPLRSATICEAAISAIQQSCDSFFLLFNK